MKFDAETGQPDLENGISPRNNFDDLMWALVVVFQVMLGEKWNTIMYDCMRSGKDIIGAIYYILLGNFDKARSFRQKRIIFEVFQILVKKKVSLTMSMDFILGEHSYNIKNKVIKWDSKIIERMHTEGETKIGQELLEEGANFMDDNEVLCPYLVSKL